MDFQAWLQEVALNAPFGQDKTMRKVWEVLDDVRSQLQVELETEGYQPAEIQRVQNRLEDYLVKTYNY